jgi:hypothetical protein
VKENDPVALKPSMPTVAFEIWKRTVSAANPPDVIACVFTCSLLVAPVIVKPLVLCDGVVLVPLARTMLSTIPGLVPAEIVADPFTSSEAEETPLRGERPAERGSRRAHEDRSAHLEECSEALVTEVLVASSAPVEVFTSRRLTFCAVPVVLNSRKNRPGIE